MDRGMAFGGGRAGGVLRVRGPVVAPALVAPALVAAAFVGAPVVAPACEFALGLMAVLVAAANPLARRAALVVLAQSTSRRAVDRWRGSFNRRIGAGLAEFLVAVAPAAPVPLVFYGFTSLACGRGGRHGTFPGAILMAMTAAVMTGPALVRPAAGPPDLYQFGSGNRFRRRGGNRIHRCAIALCGSLRCCFSTGLILRRFYRRRFHWCCFHWRSFCWRGFDRSHGLRPNFHRFVFSRLGFDRGRFVDSRRLCKCHIR